MNRDFVRRSSYPGQTSSNFMKFAFEKETNGETLIINQQTFTLTTSAKVFGSCEVVSAITGAAVTVDITGQSVKKLTEALELHGYIVGKFGVAVRKNDVNIWTLVVIGNAVVNSAVASDATSSTKVTKTVQYLSQKQKVAFDVSTAFILLVDGVDVLNAPSGYANATLARAAINPVLVTAGATYVTVTLVDGDLLLEFAAPNTVSVKVNGVVPTIVSKMIAFK